MNLAGQRVVVIGGTSGIGRAVARAALDAGAKLYIGSSNADKLASALTLLGDGVKGSTINVCEEASVEAFFAKMLPFDHLVYTAGDWTRRRTQVGAKFDLAASKESADTRFWGALLAIKYALPKMSQGGSITLTSGLYAHRPVKGTSLVTAFNGAIEHLSKGLSVDLAPIRVNTVTAGFIDTEAWNAMNEETKRELTAKQAIPRPGQPAEVAKAYIYFMNSGYTTGQVCIVDGGGLIA